MQSETGPGKEYTFSGRASRIQSAGEPRKQSGFSFIQTDREDHRMTVEFGPAAGPLDRYAIKLGCCQNPACECRVLDLVLDPIDQPQSALTIRSLSCSTSGQWSPLPASDQWEKSIVRGRLQ